MRKDVTLGLAVAIFLFGSVGAYVLFFTKSKPPENQTKNTNSGQVDKPRQEIPKNPTLFGPGNGTERIESHTGGIQAPPTQPSNHDPIAERISPPWRDLLDGGPAGGDSHTPIPGSGSRISTPGGDTHTASTNTATYVVKPGETLWSIATAVYGNGALNSRIIAANPGIDPGRLKAGMKINIPEKSSVVSNAGNPIPASSTINPTTQYRVASGDNLNSIAVSLYGTNKMAANLYEANKDLMGSPNNLKPGWVLKLPSPPSVTRTTPASSTSTTSTTTTTATTSIISAVER